MGHSFWMLLVVATGCQRGDCSQAHTPFTHGHSWLSAAIPSAAKKQKLVKEGEVALSGDHIREGLGAAVSVMVGAHLLPLLLLLLLSVLPGAAAAAVAVFGALCACCGGCCWPLEDAPLMHLSCFAPLPQERLLATCPSR